MGWHSDDDYRGPSPDIASVNLGATRRFLVRPKGGGASVPIELGHGDLLLMTGRSQLDYQHSVPKTRARVGPRINLTWRCMGPG